MRIKRKFIENDAVDGTKALIESGQSLRMKNPASVIEGVLALIAASRAQILSKFQFRDDTSEFNVQGTVSADTKVLSPKVESPSGTLDLVATDSIFSGRVQAPKVQVTGALTDPTDAVTKNYVDSADTILDGRLDTLETQFEQFPQTFEWQNSVLDLDNTPPGSPSAGSRYLVDTAPTGAWAGQANKIAEYTGTAWEFFAPTPGMAVIVDNEPNAIFVYSGSLWRKVHFLKLADGSLKLDTQGQLYGPKPKKQSFTLTAQNITDQYVDLAFEAAPDSLSLGVVGAGLVFEGSDYTLAVAGGVTRLTFAGDLAAAGASPLAAGDVLNVQYLYF